MCVKEFLGYTCGHCSTPYLRKCPMTASNPAFPVCNFPSERPIFTNGNCHPCSRVLWNQGVLKAEEEHRQLHSRSECQCEVMFDAEERERRLRTRAGKRKAKNRLEQYPQEALEEGDKSVSGGRLIEMGLATEGVGGIHKNLPDESMPGWPQQSSALEAQPAGHEYSGYYVGGPSQADMAHVAQGRGFPVGGFVQQEFLWDGQLSMRQPGAGMRWYPQSQESLLPLWPLCPALPGFPPANLQQIDKTPTNWQRAMSEPVETTSYITSPMTRAAEVAGASENQQSSPMVVSSDMVS